MRNAAIVLLTLSLGAMSPVIVMLFYDRWLDGKNYWRDMMDYCFYCNGERGCCLHKNRRRNTIHCIIMLALIAIMAFLFTLGLMGTIDP